MRRYPFHHIGRRTIIVSRGDWRRTEIVVTTVQSLLFNNNQHLFSPTDFDLVISDEVHRSIGGNARAVFDYFVGYEAGLKISALAGAI